MTQAARFRELLRQSGMIVAPGVYDGITAKLTEQAGYSTVYMSGAATSMARGYPDFGLLDMTEMSGNAGIIARTVQIPVIADADTGYGNELNVTRTIREYEKQGVAGLHIEDQVMPKRCGHLDGKQIIPAAQFASKIRAAVAARRDPDFLIIARTDARAVMGLGEAVFRVNAAIDAGADMAFVEAVQTREELATIPKQVRGPCLLNIVPGAKTPSISLRDAQSLGYRLAILPSLLLSAIVVAADDVLQAVKAGTMPDVPHSANITEVFRRFGADDWNALGQKFVSEN